MESGSHLEYEFNLFIFPTLHLLAVYIYVFNVIPTKILLHGSKNVFGVISWTSYGMTELINVTTSYAEMT